MTFWGCTTFNIDLKINFLNKIINMELLTPPNEWYKLKVNF